MVLAHAGQPLAPHDLWSAWNLHPLTILGLALAAWTYRRGRPVSRSAVGGWRAWCFAAGLVVLAVALVSPLDALAGALASAHMVQHVLLVLVAAPLLALSGPLPRMLRGSPPALRRMGVRWGRRLRLTPTRRYVGGQLTPTWRHVGRHPVVVWMAHVGAIWVWHASAPYGAALRHDALHVAEHASFLVTGVVFWAVVVRVRGAQAVPHGAGVLLVFAMALQSVFLSVLLTFARTPWYPEYATTTAAWGLEPLADQQLAGVIMWVPAGAVYVLAGLALTAAWIRDIERDSRRRELTPSGAAG